MIIDQTQTQLEKRLQIHSDLDPVKIAKMLILAKMLFPECYEDIRQELTRPTPQNQAKL